MGQSYNVESDDEYDGTWQQSHVGSFMKHSDKTEGFKVENRTNA